ncbi:MAG: response regulator [Sphingobacteriales bacterium]|nr:MAG: response regulator [Sphingobacteriales bacterium]
MNSEIKIIIIEDNENDAFLIHRELKKSGIEYAYVVVQTKAEFEKALKEFDADLILSDYSLPAFDAVSAFNIKQEIFPLLPFIIVSGIIGEENAVELIKIGVTDYVPKDNLITLSSKIKRALKDVSASQEKIIIDEKLRVQTAELIIANMELAVQIKEKEARTAELIKANKELKVAEENRDEYVCGLEAMMFLTSHKLRVPITNILGISEVLEQSLNAPEKLNKLVGFIKKSANILDDFTKELSVTMESLEKKVKDKIMETISE